MVEFISQWAHCGIVGQELVESTVKMDEKGRVVIPRKIRKAAQLNEGITLNIKSKGKTIILEAAEPVADKCFGIVRVANWPSNLDLDKYVVETEKKWRKQNAT
jgi:AbrB family looped-hinge helix DNA binding protein